MMTEAAIVAALLSPENLTDDALDRLIDTAQGSAKEIRRQIESLSAHIETLEFEHSQKEADKAQKVEEAVETRITRAQKPSPRAVHKDKDVTDSTPVKAEAVVSAKLLRQTSPSLRSQTQASQAGPFSLSTKPTKQPTQATNSKTESAPPSIQLATQSSEPSQVPKRKRQDELEIEGAFDNLREVSGKRSRKPPQYYRKNQSSGSLDPSPTPPSAVSSSRKQAPTTDVTQEKADSQLVSPPVKEKRATTQKSTRTITSTVAEATHQASSTVSLKTRQAKAQLPATSPATSVAPKAPGLPQTHPLSSHIDQSTPSPALADTTTSITTLHQPSPTPSPIKPARSSSPPASTIPSHPISTQPAPLPTNDPSSSGVPPPLRSSTRPKRVRIISPRATTPHSPIPVSEPPARKRQLLKLSGPKPIFPSLDSSTSKRRLASSHPESTSTGQKRVKRVKVEAPSDGEDEAASNLTNKPAAKALNKHQSHKVTATSLFPATTPHAPPATSNTSHTPSARPNPNPKPSKRRPSKPLRGFSNAKQGDKPKTGKRGEKEKDAKRSETMRQVWARRQAEGTNGRFGGVPVDREARIKAEERGWDGLGKGERDGAVVKTEEGEGGEGRMAKGRRGDHAGL
ncbi:uncharacterized protein KY384_001356 [Bacidia gigantensis]|uniref:uncharacterized protein n=1 Tax=Bacidia gigantensis TaxID=2732470 RepID=UPI001D03AEA9|nr:uncharacterized protein KY384_001356 [Bacidia gigantensis]KAG8533616.1 hypothetical protein KY384_001356 [Bacidia gigantensis]